MAAKRSKWGGRAAARLVALTLATYGDTCILCHRPGATSAEHLIPRKFGGPDTLANLRPAHLRCNQRRGTMPLDQWYARNLADRPPSIERDW